MAEPRCDHITLQMFISGREISRLFELGQATEKNIAGGEKTSNTRKYLMMLLVGYSTSILSSKEALRRKLNATQPINIQLGTRLSVPQIVGSLQESESHQRLEQKEAPSLPIQPLNKVIRQENIKVNLQQET